MQDGHRAVVERLLAHNARLLDLPEFKGRTALIAAAGDGHADLVRLLLERSHSPVLPQKEHRPETHPRQDRQAHHR